MRSWILFVIIFSLENTCSHKNRRPSNFISSSNIRLWVVADHVVIAHLMKRVELT